MTEVLDKPISTRMMPKQVSKQASKRNVILVGDCIEQLKTLPDESIDCCVTSPPYYGLRDYGTGKWIGGDPNCPHARISKWNAGMSVGQSQSGLVGNIGDAIFKTVCPLCGAVREDKQIGLEETPEQYVQHLVEVFREVKRVLKNDGTLWLNIGDSYSGSGKGPAGNLCKKHDEQNMTNSSVVRAVVPDGCKQKDLIGIPWMLAFALRADGWYLRQDIIWAKPNPMPESVKDRCTKSHEYIFLLSKSKSYYYDHEAISEPTKTKDSNVRDRDSTKLNNTPGRTRMGGLKTNNYDRRNKRDVWFVSTKPFKGAHFATFPEDLIEPCVLAGCRPGGTVLDPFFGSGTTGCVALKNGRDFIGIELNPEYVEIAKRRTSSVQMQFSQGVMLDV